jgi:F420-non-reducing hydrogenase iron-sulfur subunit
MVGYGVVNKLEQTVDQDLRAIGASCLRLLSALQQSPEAIWGEIMRMESICKALNEACSDLQDKSAAAGEIMTLVEALRSQMSKNGLTCQEEFAAFRRGVSTVQRCADRMRNSFDERDPETNRPLKTYVFFCSNNLDADQLAGLGQQVGQDTVETIGLPCSGKVDVPYLIKALETGADGVVIVACKAQECRHFEGSLRAHKRAEAVESLLEEIGLGVGRIAVIECAQGGARQVCEEIKQFIEQVRALPPGEASSGAMSKQEAVAA